MSAKQSFLKQPRGSKPFQRILIANRGEIALRIMRAARELGIETVAVYSDADASSQHRHYADFAIRLPGNLSSETYLDIGKLVDAIKASNADGVHPGYGFLSESDAFAEAVNNTGARFIGPSVEAMRLLGNKIAARQLMESNHIPMVPGLKVPLTSELQLKDFAQEHGYPLILKAAAGGGGRGMRVVRQDSQLKDALAACQREALAYFGNPDVFCERYLENPRHIEFQILFDHHGNGVHLFERDCSIQRRHQKLIEEAPSAYLDEGTRARLGAIAVKAGAIAGYRGAGTVEFICESPDNAYFMEVNTRIQVEHPVTEAVSGVDLIAAQIRVAEGAPLPFKQEDLKLRGWAFEARINAEDAGKDFQPAPGIVKRVRFPQGPFVRVDSHLYDGYAIPEFYDSLVAKLIVWGEDRDGALQRLRRALGEFEIDGVPTTIDFHQALLSSEEFCKGDFTTKFLESNWPTLKANLDGQSSLANAFKAALCAILVQQDKENRSVKIGEDERVQWRTKARREGLRCSE